MPTRRERQQQRREAGRRRAQVLLDEAVASLRPSGVAPPREASTRSERRRQRREAGRRRAQVLLDEAVASLRPSGVVPDTAASTAPDAAASTPPDAVASMAPDAVASAASTPPDAVASAASTPPDAVASAASTPPDAVASAASTPRYETATAGAEVGEDDDDDDDEDDAFFGGGSAAGGAESDEDEHVPLAFAAPRRRAGLPAASTAFFPDAVASAASTPRDETATAGAEVGDDEDDAFLGDGSTGLPATRRELVDVTVQLVSPLAAKDVSTLTLRGTIQQTFGGALESNRLAVKENWTPWTTELYCIETGAQIGWEQTFKEWGSGSGSSGELTLHLEIRTIGKKCDLALLTPKCVFEELHTVHDPEDPTGMPYHDPTQLYGHKVQYIAALRTLETQRQILELELHTRNKIEDAGEFLCTYEFVRTYMTRPGDEVQVDMYLPCEHFDTLYLKYWTMQERMTMTLTGKIRYVDEQIQNIHRLSEGRLTTPGLYVQAEQAELERSRRDLEEIRQSERENQRILDEETAKQRDKKQRVSDAQDRNIQDWHNEYMLRAKRAIQALTPTELDQRIRQEIEGRTKRLVDLKQENMEVGKIYAFDDDGGVKEALDAARSETDLALRTTAVNLAIQRLSSVVSKLEPGSDAHRLLETAKQSMTPKTLGVAIQSISRALRLLQVRVKLVSMSQLSCLVRLVSRPFQEGDRVLINAEAKTDLRGQTGTIHYVDEEDDKILVIVSDAKIPTVWVNKENLTPADSRIMSCAWTSIHFTELDKELAEKEQRLLAVLSSLKGTSEEARLSVLEWDEMQTMAKHARYVVPGKTQYETVQSKWDALCTQTAKQATEEKMRYVDTNRDAAEREYAALIEHGEDAGSADAVKGSYLYWEHKQQKELKVTRSTLKAKRKQLPVLEAALRILRTTETDTKAKIAAWRSEHPDAFQDDPTYDEDFGYAAYEEVEGLETRYPELHRLTMMIDNGKKALRIAQFKWDACNRAIPRLEQKLASLDDYAKRELYAHELERANRKFSVGDAVRDIHGLRGRRMYTPSPTDKCMLCLREYWLCLKEGDGPIRVVCGNGHSMCNSCYEGILATFPGKRSDWWKWNGRTKQYSPSAGDDTWVKYTCPECRESYLDVHTDRQLSGGTVEVEHTLGIIARMPIDCEGVVVDGDEPAETGKVIVQFKSTLVF